LSEGQTSLAALPILRFPKAELWFEAILKGTAGVR